MNLTKEPRIGQRMTWRTMNGARSGKTVGQKETGEFIAVPDVDKYDLSIVHKRDIIKIYEN